jgi:DNA-binding response OmpR family regulator
MRPSGRGAFGQLDRFPTLSAQFRIVRIGQIRYKKTGMKRLGDIIMADDNGNDVSLVSYALRDAGLNLPIQWIKDGNTLVHYLKQNQRTGQMPLLIVIDWNMPGTNTLHILKWIRTQPEYLNVLIAVLTGSENPIQKKLAYEAGANWHIVKSAAFEELTELIRRIKGFWSPDNAIPRFE